MSEKVFTSSLPHAKSLSFVDERIDQFNAFAIAWNGEESIHVTFGRNSLRVKTSNFYRDGVDEGVETPEVEALRLDVAGISMPVETARDLAAALTRMVAQAEARSQNRE